MCLLLALPAAAGTGKCDSNFDCKFTCGHTTHVCTIQVTTTPMGGDITKDTAISQPLDDQYQPVASDPGRVCVNAGTTVVWVVDPKIDKSAFTAEFDIDNPFEHYPFSVTFNGGTGPIPNSVVKRPDDVSELGCYSYNLQVCQDGKCTAVNDPKVIVGGANIKMHSKKHSSAPPKTKGQ